MLGEYEAGEEARAHIHVLRKRPRLKTAPTAKPVPEQKGKGGKRGPEREREREKDEEPGGFGADEVVQLGPGLWTEEQAAEHRRRTAQVVLEVGASTAAKAVHHGAAQGRLHRRLPAMTGNGPAAPICSPPAMCRPRPRARKLPTVAAAAGACYCSC